MNSVPHVDPEIRRMLAEAAQVGAVMAASKTSIEFNLHFGYDYAIKDPSILSGFVDVGGESDQLKLLVMDVEGSERHMFGVTFGDSIEITRHMAQTWPGYIAAARKLLDDMEEADGGETEPATDE